MQLEIFEKYSRVRIGIIKTYTYLTYEDIMDDRGNFEIRIPAKTQTLSLLSVGNYIWFENGIVGIIKGKKDTEDEEFEATIYGYLANELLGYRSFLKTSQYYDEINDITTQMLSDLFINPEDAKRRMDFISVQNDMPTFSDKIRVQNTGDSLLSYLAEMYFPYDLGFELYPIFENEIIEGEKFASISTFEFRLLKPVDRTYNNQDGNVPVVFSFDLSNLQKIDHEEDSRSYSSVALVASEGTGGDRKTIEVGDTTSEGIDRIELYVDARDIQSDADPENPLTDEELEEIMKERGDEKLKEHQSFTSFEATIIEGKYKYGVDFYKADFVSVIDKNTNIIHNVQVNSVKKTISNGVEHLDIIFGKDKLAVSEMSSRRTVLTGGNSSGGGGGGSSTLAGLSDVDVSGVSNGDVLAYNSTSHKWEDKGLSIPTKTSDLTNDSNFVSDSTYVHTDNNYSTNEKNKLSGIEAGAEVNVQSDWSESSSSSDSYIQNKPTKLSDFTNDQGFIDNTVNSLTNYYKKTETYTQSEVDSLISAIVTLDIEVVQTLPTTDISTTTIYLVPKQSAGTSDVYDEYINTTGTSAGWELIGTTQVDLSNYYTKSEVDALIPDDLADLNDDSTHRLVTDTEKAAWDAKVSAHIIKNDSGTSLSQKDNLKFAGTYSSNVGDDSVVNIVRTMTLAQFNQLSNDEKKGLIDVVDEAGQSLPILPFTITENTTLGGYDVTYPS